VCEDRVGGDQLHPLGDGLCNEQSVERVFVGSRQAHDPEDMVRQDRQEVNPVGSLLGDDVRERESER
jgi:hypothetical protein